MSKSVELLRQTELATEECIYQNPGQSSLGFETDCLSLWHFTSAADIVGIRIYVIMIPMDT